MASILRSGLANPEVVGPYTDSEEELFDDTINDTRDSRVLEYQQAKVTSTSHPGSSLRRVQNVDDKNPNTIVVFAPDELTEMENPGRSGRLDLTAAVEDDESSAPRFQGLAPWRIVAHRCLYEKKGPGLMPKIARFLNIVFTAVLLLSLVTLCLGTVSGVIRIIPLRNAVFWLDCFNITVFTVELAMHAIAAPQIRDMFKWIYLVDLLAIVPFFVELILAAVTSENGDVITKMFGFESFAALRVLRLLRLVRLLKLFKKSSKLQTLGKALRDSGDGIALLLFILPVLILFFGTVLYYAEQTWEYYDLEKQLWFYDDGEPSPFQSIPDSFWLILITLTTIGYGDVVPRTLAGRLVISTTMVTALFVIAFPLTMLSIQYAQVVRLFAQRQRRKKFLNALEKERQKSATEKYTREAEANGGGKRGFHLGRRLGRFNRRTQATRNRRFSEYSVDDGEYSLREVNGVHGQGEMSNSRLAHGSSKDMFATLVFPSQASGQGRYDHDSFQAVGDADISGANNTVEAFEADVEKESNPEAPPLTDYNDTPVAPIASTPLNRSPLTEYGKPPLPVPHSRRGSSSGGKYHSPRMRQANLPAILTAPEPVAEANGRKRLTASPTLTGFPVSSPPARTSLSTDGIVPLVSSSSKSSIASVVIPSLQVPSPSASTVNLPTEVHPDVPKLTNTQLLDLNEDGEVWAGTALTHDGINVWEMERSMDNVLDGTAPDAVVVRVMRWEHQSKPIPLSETQGPADSLPPEEEDVMVMRIAVKSDEEYRKLILLLAGFQTTR
ncbi:hypothetical protein HK102_007480 [Quaeritorhiza haematococci]|nr:hypothetical protein HK102_007480 [Quaeritorhiza haematococci]